MTLRRDQLRKLHSVAQATATSKQSSHHHIIITIINHNHHNLHNTDTVLDVSVFRWTFVKVECLKMMEQIFLIYNHIEINR